MKTKKLLIAVLLTALTVTMTACGKNETVNDETENVIQEEPVDKYQGVSPSFKEAMDSYEKFFDEFVAFMEKYSDIEEPDASIMADYLRYASQYEKTVEKIQAIDEKELSDEDALYYAEVMLRITYKLSKVGK